MKKNLAIQALDMTVRLRKPPEDCIFHSDRGSQYCAYDYQKRLQKYKLTPSMSGKGNRYDCDCDKLLRLGGLTHVTIDCVSLH
jgi:putative transposase